MNPKPRRLALVKFSPPPAIRGTKAARCPFRKDETYAFLGEIPNMPGHCVVAASRTGKIHTGYHTQLFIELSSDDV